jgi:hypothetical protein
MPTTDEMLARISELEAQLAQAKGPELQPVSTTRPSAETRPESWPGLVYRVGTHLAQVWTRGTLGRISIVIAVLIVAGIAAMTYPPTGNLIFGKPATGEPSSKGKSASGTAAPPLPVMPGVSASEVGLQSMWTGAYAHEEDDLLASSLRAAKSVKIMAYNADTLIQNMSPELEAFFDRSGASMQFLLANPNDAYYIQNTVLTLRRPLSPQEQTEYQAHFHDAVSRLKTLERDKGQQVEIRFFQNEMRVPIIIVDDHLCFLTLRLPPFESKKSLRFVFDTAPRGFNENCVEHFNKVWSVSQASSKRLDQL